MADKFALIVPIAQRYFVLMDLETGKYLDNEDNFTCTIPEEENIKLLQDLADPVVVNLVMNRGWGIIFPENDEF